LAENLPLPVTLADKLGAVPAPRSSKILTRVIVLCIIALLAFGANSGSYFETEEVVLYSIAAILAYVVFLFITSYVVTLFGRPANGRPSKRHFLFRYDTLNFMGSLVLSEKTALFDGNNVYHFGIKNGVGTQPLAYLVRALRAEGYRIVCFFDANIFYTLRDNGDLAKSGQRFSSTVLVDKFGLEHNEIYVVPRGVQADRFIVETLSHLPISFAVTNDRFRDFEADYDMLAKDKSWRKGIRFQSKELVLHQHSFSNAYKIK